MRRVTHDPPTPNKMKDSELGSGINVSRSRIVSEDDSTKEPLADAIGSSREEMTPPLSIISKKLVPGAATSVILKNCRGLKSNVSTAPLVPGYIVSLP
jgi:hypothetical protein